MTEAEALDTNMDDYVDIQRFPILFQYAHVDTTTQGLGALPDWLNGTVTASLNQWAVLSGTYKLQGIKADKIDIDEVIMIDCGPNWLHQLFKITHVTPSLEGIQVDGVQVAGYFLNKNPVKKVLQFPVASPNAAWKLISDNLEDPHPELGFDSDVSTNADVDFPAATNASNLLLDSDQEGDKATQSIPGLFGGEVWADNFQIHHREHQGRFRNFVIKYGKDIRTLDQDKNIEDVYTGCFFHAEYQPGQPKANISNVNWSGFQTDWTSVGTVTFAANGAVPIYDAPVVGHHQIGTLTRGQRIKVGKLLNNGDMVPDLSKPNVQLEVDTVYGDSWYPLSDGGWIDSKWVTFDKSGDYLVTNAQGHGTTDITNITSRGTKFPVTGTAVVTYIGNGDKIHIYYSPFQGPDHYRRKKSNGSYETLTNGQTIHFLQEAIDENGHSWYRIGSHKWVYGPHLSLSKSNAYASYPAYGKGYVKKNAQKYVINKKGKVVPAAKHTVIVSTKGKKTKESTWVRRKIHGRERKVKKLNASYFEGRKKKVKTTVNSGYATIHSQIVMGGVTYYKVGHGVLVKSSDFDWKKKKSVPPKMPKQLETQSAIKEGKIEIYSKPSTNSAINWAVDTGTSLDIQYTAKGADGQDWDYVTFAGQSGWILNKYMNYKADADYAPVTSEDTSEGDDTDALPSTVDQEEVRVELPEGALIADNWIGREAQNIEDVDLSSYIAHDDTDFSGQQPDGSFVATQDDINQLRTAAQNYMIEHKIGEIPVSLTIDYVQIRNIFGNLQDIGLGDTVGVEFDPAGIRQNSEITTTVWNWVAQRFDSITVGDPPKTYEHLLKDAVKQDTDTLKRSTDAKIGNALSLTSQIHSALQQEGASRNEAEVRIAKELGMINTAHDKLKGTVSTLAVSLKDLNSALNSYDSEMEQAKNWILSGGSNVLQFLDANGNQTYVNPVEIRAKTGNDGWMVFNSNGLGYYDGNQETVTSIDSRGWINAEYINAGVIKDLHAQDLTMTGHFMSQVGGYTITIGEQNPEITGNVDSSRGVAVGTQGYGSVLGSGVLTISGTNGANGNYGPSYVEIQSQDKNYIRIEAGQRLIYTGGNGQVSYFLKTTDNDPSIAHWISRHWVGAKHSWSFS